MSYPQLSEKEFNATRAPGALASNMTTRILALVVIALRFYARHRGGQRFWWDDWLVLCTAIFWIGATVTEIYAYELGLGRHIQWVLQHKPDGLPTYSKLMYFQQVLYPVLLGPIKASVLCLYLRLFGIRNGMRRACYIQLGLVVCWTLAVLFLFMFRCRPTSATWSTSPSRDQCIQYPRLLTGLNSADLALDVGILITPLPSIWVLNLSKLQKLWVSSLMMLGAGSVVFSAVRLAMFQHKDFDNDPTWEHIDALRWYTIGEHLSVLCACIPTLVPILPRQLVERARWKIRDLRERIQQGCENQANGSIMGSHAWTAVRNGRIAAPNPSNEEEQNLTGAGAEPVLNPWQIRRTVEFVIVEERVEVPEAVEGLSDEKSLGELSSEAVVLSKV